MQVSQATLEDGRNCAILIQLLKAGRWNFTGGDIAAYASVMKWVQDMAAQLAPQMKEKDKSPAAAPPTAAAPSPDDASFSVLSMGKLPPASKKSSGRKKK